MCVCVKVNILSRSRSVTTARELRRYKLDLLGVQEVDVKKRGTVRVAKYISVRAFSICCLIGVKFGKGDAHNVAENCRVC